MYDTYVYVVSFFFLEKLLNSCVHVAFVLKKYSPNGFFYFDMWFANKYF